MKIEELINQYETLTSTDNESDSFFLLQLLNKRDEQRYTPIHQSIFDRDFTLVEKLLKYGADIGIKCHGSPPLHLTLSTANLPAGRDFGLTCFKFLFEESGNTLQKDDQGYSIVHLSCEFDLPEALDAIASKRSTMKKLINLGTSLGMVTPFHKAAINDSLAAAAKLLEIANSFESNQSNTSSTTEFEKMATFLSIPEEKIDGFVQQLCILTSKDYRGMTGLHYCVCHGSPKVWKLIIETLKHLLGKEHISQKGYIIPGCPLEIANSRLKVHEMLVESLQLLSKNGWKVDPLDFSTIEPLSTCPPTAIISSKYCFQHHTCPPKQLRSREAPPENIRRLEVLLHPMHGILRGQSKEIQSRLKWVLQPPENCIAISDILKVHEWSYVRQVQIQCEKLMIESQQSRSAESETDSEAFTGSLRPPSLVSLGMLDGDTVISQDTYKAAIAAAGSVCHGVDLVMNKQCRNAFCAIRPPGHHAGPTGVVKLRRLVAGSGSTEENEDMEVEGGGGPDSHGFCIFNNISVGAAYAMNRYRETVKRVAIIDFDVHHGNGTEETIRWLRPGLSIQNYPNQFQSPIHSSHCFVDVQTPYYKPWLSEEDAKNVLFVSVHGYGPRDRESLQSYSAPPTFYPGSGATKLPDMDKLRIADKEKKGESHPSHRNGESVEGQEEDEEEVGMEGKDEDQDDADDDENDRDEDDNDEDEEEDNEDEDVEDMEDIEGGGLKAGIVEEMGRSLRKEITNQMKFREETPAEVSKKIQLTRQKLFDGSKSKRFDAEPLILDVGVPLPPDDLGDGTDLTNLSTTQQLIMETTYRFQWRNYFREHIFPRILTFRPDFIFISAGFDAHKKDTINAGYIALVEDDFDWITSEIQKLATTCCEGRIISALEGGYQLGGEHCSAFARSVKAHVAALSRPVVRSFDLEENEQEKIMEEAWLRQMQETEEAHLMEQAARNNSQEDLGPTSSIHEVQEDPMQTESMETKEVMEEVKFTEEKKEDGVIDEADLMQTESKKRRRQQVDYVALEKKLQSEAILK